MDLIKNFKESAIVNIYKNFSKDDFYIYLFVLCLTNNRGSGRLTVQCQNHVRDFLKRISTLKTKSNQAIISFDLRDFLKFYGCADNIELLYINFTNYHKKYQIGFTIFFAVISVILFCVSYYFKSFIPMSVLLFIPFMGDLLITQIQHLNYLNSITKASGSTEYCAEFKDSLKAQLDKNKGMSAGKKNQLAVSQESLENYNSSITLNKYLQPEFVIQDKAAALIVATLKGMPARWEEDQYTKPKIWSDYSQAIETREVSKFHLVYEYILQKYIDEKNYDKVVLCWHDIFFQSRDKQKIVNKFLSPHLQDIIPGLENFKNILSIIAALQQQSLNSGEHIKVKLEILVQKIYKYVPLDRLDELFEGNDYKVTLND